MLRRRLFRLKCWIAGLLALAPLPVVAQAAVDPLAQPRFAQEVAAFSLADSAAPPPACPVLFVGSSSIRMWANLPGDMAPLPVINRGFGGAEIDDVNRWFDAVVAPYRPRAIVFYAGENDLAAGKPPEQVVADFQRFMDLKSNALGTTPVFFTSLKPSLLRFNDFAAQSQVNSQIKAMADARPDLEYLDVASLMLQDGAPKPLYLMDGLHMNADGYALWRAAIGEALTAARLPDCVTPPGPDTAASPAGRTAPG